MSKKDKRRVSQEEIDELYLEDKFYNYGDNPIFKKFMYASQAN